MQILFDKIRPRSGAQFTHANTRSKSTQGLRMFSLRSRVSFERYLAPPYVNEPSLVRTTRKLSVLEETCHLLRNRNTEYNTFILFKAGFILAYDDAQKLAFIHVMCVKWSQTWGGGGVKAKGFGKKSWKRRCQVLQLISSHRLLVNVIHQ